MISKMNSYYHYLFLVSFFIFIIALEGVHGRNLAQLPNATVPISSQIPPEPRPDPPPKPQVHCYAVVRTILDNSKKFYGSTAFPNLYKPQVQGYQWSAARIKLMNGPDSIEAGWIVFPDYYKDNEAHLYARFTAAGSKGCFNTDCPGFVQIPTTNTPLGSTPREYSTILGKQVEWRISIDKHLDDGNWWLSMSWENIGTQQIGYWPESLFTGLKDAAAQVEWGGEINNPGAASPAPAMGSSLKAIDDPNSAAFFQHITVVDENSITIVPQATENFKDCPELYTVLDWGDRGGDLGRVIFYGGS